MISWKLTTDFNEERHLFSNKINTDYIVETYICSCGHKHFITRHAYQNTSYQCSECENTKFYNANHAWENITHFLYQHLDLKISYKYEVQSNDETINSLYLTEIPQHIDFTSQKVFYGKKTVYSLLLSNDGKIKENYSLQFEPKILLQLKENLVQYIVKNNCYGIPTHAIKKLTPKIARFFKENKNFKDYEFYYWEDIPKLDISEMRINDALNHIANYPKAKSVKKALYANYLKQIKDYGSYNSSLIEAWCQTIKDVNILRELLILNLKYTQYDNFDKTGLKQIIIFLKSHYSEKQILNLFSSKKFSSNYNLFCSAVSTLADEQKLIEHNFIRVACKVQELHDEFLRCGKYKNIRNQEVHYLQKDTEPCIELDKYQVKLPKNGQELFKWAGSLHNCMAEYFEDIKNRRAVIYCFFKDNKLKFAVEICHTAIVQARGKNNRNLTEKEMLIVKEWYQSFFSQNVNEKLYAA
jgi:hypothetical protein